MLRTIYLMRGIEIDNLFKVYLIVSELYDKYMWIWGLWCLTSLSTIFQLYRGDQFY